MSDPTTFVSSDHSGVKSDIGGLNLRHGMVAAPATATTTVEFGSSLSIQPASGKTSEITTDYWSKHTDDQLAPYLLKSGGFQPQIGSTDEPKFQPPEQITVQGSASIGYIASGTQITFLNGQNKVIEIDTFSGDTMTVAAYLHPKVQDVVAELNSDITFGTLSSGDIASHISLLSQGGESYALARSAISHSSAAAGALQAVYKAELGRDVDPSGLKTYEDALGRGWELADVMAALAYSPEAVTDLKSMISDVQGRSATSNDNAWVTAQQNLLANYQTLAGLRSALAHFSGESGVVNSVFQGVLGRNATQAEISATEDKLSGNYSINQLRQDLAYSQEAVGNLKKMISDVQGRTASSADTPWISDQQQALASGTSASQVRYSLAHWSGETNLINTAFQRAVNRDASSTDITGNEDYISNGGNLTQVIYDVFHSNEAYNYQSNLLQSKLSAPTEEGDNATAYYDSLGVLTVGIGHKVLSSDNIAYGQTISEQQVNAFFQQDTASALSKARQQVDQAGITVSNFVVALADADFQLGDFVFKNPNTWNQIVSGDYTNAASSLNQGVWMQQTPVRVQNLQAALRALPAKGT